MTKFQSQKNGTAKGTRQSISSGRGFTLVELLVVIGIIALLISILLPALSRARDQAKSVTCLANMKQIGMAAFNYASENKGIWAPAAWWNGAAGTESESWPNILVNAGYLKSPDINKGQDPTRSVFYCPNGNPDLSASFTSSSGASAVPQSKTDGAGQTYRPCPSVSTGEKLGTWYGINASTGGGDIGSVPLIRSCNDSDPAGSTNFSSSLTKLSAIRQAASTVYIYDGVYMNLTVNSARVNARHGRQTQTNLCFFDGHAATFKTAELPGGLGIGNATDFGLANLNANYPAPAPRWRLNQN